jgi:predicted Zn-dependent protease
MSCPPKTDCNRASAHPDTQLIEIGWVVAGRLDEADRQAVEQARDGLQRYLQRTFPTFTWRLPMLHREELGQGNREDIVVLLEYGMTEREVKHWDFAIVVTGSDLISHYKPYALGAPSHSVNVAILSTLRLDPQVTHHTASAEERISVMAHRIGALVLHLLGHLNGLPHHEDPHNYMYDLQTVDDLDHMADFSAGHQQRLVGILNEVADLRLEEAEPAARTHPVRFYLRGIKIGWRDIVSAVLRARPWEFPFRLSRLTAAGLSALLVLLVTAEVWEVGMRQPIGRVVGLSLIALLLTSIYILKRQRLLTRRQMGPLSEQIVVAHIAIAIVVLSGLLTTYGLFLGGALLLASTLFQRQIIVGWAASLHGDVHTLHYVVLAGFVASLGLLIGALGASFEQQHYFRHITYIDEET